MSSDVYVNGQMVHVQALGTYKEGLLTMSPFPLYIGKVSKDSHAPELWENGYLIFDLTFKTLSIPCFVCLIAC